MDIRSSATKNPGSSGQPIKRTVGFAIAGDDDDGDEPVPFSLEGDGVELRAGGASTGRASVTDGDGVVGSPSPVLIMPTSLDAGGASASSSMKSPRGVRRVVRDRSIDLARPHDATPRARARFFAPSVPPPPRSLTLPDRRRRVAQIPEIMQSVRNMKVQSAPQATPPKRAPPPKPRSPNKASSPSKTPPAPRPPPAAAAPKSAAREDEAAAKEAEKAAKAAEKAARKAAHLAASGGGGGGGGAGGAPSEKPKLSKAERRAQQEAQRAAKEAAKSVSAPAAAAPGGGGKKEKKEQGGGGGGGGGGGESEPAAAAGSDSPAASSSKAIKAIKAERAASASSSKARPQSKLVDSFSHLRQYRAPPTKQHTSLAGATAAGVACHPAVARLAERYADGSIRGGRARCIALLHTLKIVIADFQTPSDAKYAHALTTCVNAVVQHIQSARAMAVSMGNAVKARS